MHELIPVIFWVVYAASGLLTLALLAGIVWRHHQLDTARHHVDDGSEDPRSMGYQVHALTRVSDAIALAACVGIVLTFMAGMAGGLGGIWLKIGSGLAAVLLLASAELLRRRHARLETEFKRLTGEPPAETFWKIHENQAA